MRPIGAGKIIGAEERSRPSWVNYVAACLTVIVAALIAEAWQWFLSSHDLSLPFIIVLMLAGDWFGLKPALVASVLGFLVYNFFLTTPRYDLSLSLADLLPLATFLATALLAGGMAGRLSDRARSAADRLRWLTTLFSASRDLSAAANVSDVGRSLVQHLKADGGVEAAIWLLDNGSRSLLATTTEHTGVETHKSDPLSLSQLPKTAAPQFTSLSTARGEVGLAAIWPNKKRMSEAEQGWLDALFQLGAIALDRAGLAAEISEARLIAEREGLRTALLSSLSHDLRTPIATILASASSLAEQDAKFDSSTRAELLDAIQEQAERLNRYVSNLLDMTRLETGVLVVKRVLVDPVEAMAAALERARRPLSSLRVARQFNAVGAMISVDPVLIEQALVNVLENAAGFSSPGSRILAAVSVACDEVVMSIADDGPGIPANELPRIFDKFFRGEADRQRSPGVGLGLSVVRGIIEAFEGRVGVESPVANGRGARFTIRLPVHQAMEMME